MSTTITDQYVEVSIGVKANIKITEEMKDKIKREHPATYEMCKDDDEGLAIAVLYAAMDELLGKHMPSDYSWSNVVSDIELC